MALNASRPFIILGSRPQYGLSRIDMWLLYQLVFGLGLVVASPFLLIARGSHYLATVRGRLGYSGLPRARSTLWIHAVSVGEVGVATTLLAALSPARPTVVTTVTPTGQERARSTLSERAAVAYLPFELGFAIRRFLGHFSPQALILVEGEYWPLLIRALSRDRIPIAVVNGRVSDRSFRRMKRLKRLLGPLFRPIESFGVQTDRDRARLIELGVPEDRVTTTGNLKFESVEPAPLENLRRRLASLAASRPVLLAGSTMRGEEALVLEGFLRAGGGSKALLVLAPRHPERWDEVEGLLHKADLSYQRRSRVTPETPGTQDTPLDVLLLDTLGELAGLYRHADGAFIGGTLVPTGGHNPLEAARFGVPIVVGPSMENFREIADIFEGAAAWRQVDSVDELAAVLTSWWDKPERARELGRAGERLLANHRGALERTLELLQPILERVR